MTKPFDMELFLAGVLTGSHATRQRHLRQARIIQAEIAERWKRATPWAWQRKHLVWFLEHRLARRCEATRYYYLLTVRLLARRLEKHWLFKYPSKDIIDIHALTSAMDRKRSVGSCSFPSNAAGGEK